MKNSATCSRALSFSRPRASHVALAIASAASVASVACSGYYPLGDVSRDQQLLDGAEPGASAPSGDAQVEVSLAAPEVTIGSDEVGITTLVAIGDMDGDGFGDMAVTSDDPATGLYYAHVRYGGPRPRDPNETLAFERSGAFLTLDEFFPLFVYAAGDVDADGRADLLVTTGQCDVTRPGEGAYLVYGGERMTGTLPLLSVATRFAPPVREGEHLSDAGCGGTGRAIGAGDVDGDGIGDIVFDRDPGMSWEGEPVFDGGEGAYLFYGRSERFSGEVQFSDADASFHVARRVQSSAAGDVNGDGLADVLVTPVIYEWPPLGQHTFVLAGRGERYGGPLDLAASTLLVADAVPEPFNQLGGPGDFDGDGLADLILTDVQGIQHLFYGSPDLFDDGIHLEQSDAVFPQSELSAMYPAGDRDGDGDDELLDHFGIPDEQTIFRTDVAFRSGSRQRLSGEVLFPESELIAESLPLRFPGDTYRVLATALPAGDLDGDGAADLFTVSHHMRRHGEGSLEVDAYRIHIHYGAPAAFARDPR